MLMPNSIEQSQFVGGLLAPEIQELIDQKRTAEVYEALAQLQDPEVADLLDHLESPHHRMVVFRFLSRERQAEVFAHLNAEHQERLLQDLSNEQLAQLLEDMATDDRTTLLEEMTGEVTARLLALLKPEDRKRTQFLLGYPPQSVGRIMTPDYLAVRSNWTIQQALDHIRKYGRDAETFSMLYVVDEKGRLLDDLRLRHLLLDDPATPIKALLDGQFPALQATDDQEEAVRMMERYDRPVLPVVNSEGILVGIVTFDDVADVAEEETTEDIHKMGGMEALDEPYLAVPLLSLVRHRGVWLSVLFLGQMLTATAIAHYQDSMKAAYVLTMFIPLIISSGGNCGSQAATLIIRAMAIGEVTLKQWFVVLRRELVCGALLGLLLGVLGLLRIILWQYTGWADYTQDETFHYMDVALTVGIGIFGVVTWGSLMGGLLPIIIKRLGLDPATISTPFIATLVDVTGLIIYFNAAILILQL